MPASTSMNFASIIATLTPRNSAFSPIQFRADTTWDEEEWLGEPQPAKERGRRFMSNDGQRSVTIHRFASNGTRDFSMIDGPEADQLIGWAQQNPTVHFDMVFTYQRDEVDGTSIRTQKMFDCFVQNTPARALSNDVVVTKFTINYNQLSVINSQTGNPVS